MLGKDFDRIADAYLLHQSIVPAWTGVGPGSFIRNDVGGFDKLAFDPGRGFENFAVLISYQPSDLTDFMEALQGQPYDPVSSGFICGPYLSLGKVGPRRHTWPCRTQEQLLSSLERVVTALAQMGEPWLASLRDPQVLAQQTDPIAAAIAGYAWERAGHLQNAHACYLDWLQRLEDGQELLQRQRKNLPPQRMQEYLFLAQKMGLNNELTARFQAVLAQASY